jgi:hypothetical protein
MKCKFCGCTEDKPCLMTEVTEYADSYVLGDGIQLIPEGAKTNLIPCAWMRFNVGGICICNAPACVEKAYREARPLAEQIDEALRVEWMQDERGAA